MGRFTGSWAKRSTAPLSVPLKPPIDPEHSTPTNAPELGASTWQDTSPAPVLPDEIANVEYYDPMNSINPILDNTPNDASFGVGVGPGLDTYQAQEIRTELMSDDRGAVAFHAWEPRVDRDGQPYVSPIEDNNVSGDSPSTTMLRNRRGVGTEQDPQARRGRPKLKRWYDRVIDMHWYNPEFRPAVIRNAYSAQPQPASVDGAPYSSPYGTIITQQGDRLNASLTYVNPQMRRTPSSPQAPTSISDGIVPGEDYALGNWGL